MAQRRQQQRLGVLAPVFVVVRGGRSEQFDGNFTSE
jgi:hypothetical protein